MEDKASGSFLFSGFKNEHCLIIELKGNFLKWEILCWEQAKQFSRNFFPSLHNSSQKVVELKQLFAFVPISIYARG